jgi:hypothetical protein
MIQRIRLCLFVLFCVSSVHAQITATIVGTATDAIVAKIHRFKERFKIQFRAEFFNLFNHTNSIRHRAPPMLRRRGSA